MERGPLAGSFLAVVNDTVLLELESDSNSASLSGLGSLLSLPAIRSELSFGGNVQGKMDGSGGNKMLQLRCG